jgi:hypothetical protein
MSTDVIDSRPGPGGHASRPEAARTDPTLAGVTSPLILVALAAVLAAAVHVVMALDLPGPWIVPDELIYSELAKSLGSGALPAVRGEVTWGYGILYPLLISPAWAVFDDPSRAYVAAKVVNSMLLGVTAFPAYFLARKFVETRAAVAVAAFSVFVPSMLYSGTLLTEVVLYPVFVLALLGIASAIRRPTRRNQLLAVGAVALACSAKPLSIILAGVYVLAVVHLGLLDRRAGGTLGTRLRAHSTALGTFLGLGALAVVGPTVLAGNPDAALGVYGVVLGNVDVSSMLVWFVRHLADLDLYVGLVPFAATVVLLARSLAGRGDRVTDEFVALAGWTIVCMVATVAAYASKPLAGGEGYIATEARLHERNMFAIVPLLLIGLALWLERGRPGGRRLKAGSVGAAIALAALLPIERLGENVNFQAPSLVLWMADGITGLWPFTLVPLAAVVFVVALGRGDRSRVGCWAVVGAVFAATTLAAHGSMSVASGGASTVGIGQDSRWIDRAVPDGADVLALWVSPGPDGDFGPASRDIWMSEFYNRTVGRVVEVGTPMPYDLPHEKGTIADGILRAASGDSITARYVLAPCGVVVQGQVVAHDPQVDALVYRVSGAALRVTPAPRLDAVCPRDAEGTPG